MRIQKIVPNLWLQIYFSLFKCSWNIPTL